MIETETVMEAYERLGRNKQAVADELGVARATVVYHVQKANGPAKAPKVRPSDVLEAYERLGHNKDAVARALGIARGTVQHHIYRAQKKGDKPMHSGRITFMETKNRALPKKGKVARYLLTSAQNNTPVHAALWANLLALAKHYDAEILVSQFTYNKSGWAARGGKQKPGTEVETDPELWYAPEIAAYVCNTRVALAPNLVFCGELDILPTAVRPLSGFETYTGPASCIIPHVKIALESVPRRKGLPPKMNYTTGACTQINYLQRKTGQKAEFHHAFGACIVEVDSAGEWFVRQLNASQDGTIYDLEHKITGGKVKHGNWISAVVWGDIHVEVLDSAMAALAWGKGGIKDALRPRYEFFHDLLDFRRRNHHDVGNPHKAYRKWVTHHESVEGEIRDAATFLQAAHRPWCTSVVVSSNHDEAFEKWLRIADWRNDPINAVLYLEANLAALVAIRDGADFYAPEWAIRRAGSPEDVVFLKPDQGYLINDIECGDHGHRGPNGFRGSPAALVRTGRKSFCGHIHSPCILDGYYGVGVMGALDQGYNVGPTSWSHTNGLIYENGKRAMFTIRNGKWRA